MSSKIADVLDRQSAVVERKIIASRKQRAARLQAIRQIEVACVEHEKRMRRLCPKGHVVITVQHMQDVLRDGKRCDHAVKKMRELDSTLRIELKRIATERVTLCKTLVGIRYKADFLRDRRNAKNRKASRRRMVRDLAGNY